VECELVSIWVLVTIVRWILAEVRWPDNESHVRRREEFLGEDNKG
jgi:hypothetical protein